MAGFPALRMFILAGRASLIAQAGVTGGAATGDRLGPGRSGSALRRRKARPRSNDRLLPRRSWTFGHPVGAGLLAVFALAVATTGFWAYGPLLLATMFGIDPGLRLYPGPRSPGLERRHHGRGGGTVSAGRC